MKKMKYLEGQGKDIGGIVPYMEILCFIKVYYYANKVDKRPLSPHNFS